MDADFSVLRKQAHIISSSGKPSPIVLSELKQWASKNGPMAMKFAMIEFLTEHGGSPEAVILMPELIRTASMSHSPVERKELLELAKLIRGSFHDQKPALPSLDTRLPVEGMRPALALNFRPQEGTKILTPSSDIRDSHLRLRETMTTMGSPFPPMELPAKERFDPSKSPDSIHMSSYKSERIVKQMIEKLRTHARDEQPRPQAKRVVKAAKVRHVAKTAKAVKKRAKVRPKPKKARRKARK